MRMAEKTRSRFYYWALWIGGGWFALTLGLIMGFYLWSPHVVAQFNRVLANTSDNTVVYDRDDQVVSTVEGLEDRHTISINYVHPYLQKAVVAVEDRRFFSHRGLDPIRLFGALVANMRSLAYYQGASTITQQLVKLTLLTPERTLTRKIKEVFMSVALEMEFSKLKLLEFYLNRVYLGFGLYGVENASRAYFGKSASNLALNEAIFLAALIKKPEGYLIYPEEKVDPKSPFLPLQHLDGLNKRRRLVLSSLGNLGWISEEEVNQALSAKLMVRRPKSEKHQNAPYFVQQVMKELKRILDIPQISGRGYRIYTTLNSQFQRSAEVTIDNFSRNPGQASQASMVTMDVKTGEVLALVGGVDFGQSQFNRATQAMRQPGSSFKPFVYATALEKEMPVNMVFQDEPVKYVWDETGMKRLRGDDLMFDDPTDPFSEFDADNPIKAEEEGAPEVYQPRNYNNTYGSKEARNSGLPLERGMTLSRALEISSNVIAVQLLDQIGINSLVRLGSRLNMAVRPQMGLCIALGCSEVTLLDLTAGYSTFANGGLRAAPVFIRKVVNTQGDVLYEYFPDPPEQVISRWTAFQMNNILSSVVKRGTGWRARMNRPVAGKTGTNDGSRDAWFIGYTPKVVTGVWVGNDDNSEMINEFGGKTPARLWALMMRNALPESDGLDFPEPDIPYVAVKTCTISGDLANNWCPEPHLYFYREDKAPQEVCQIHPANSEQREQGKDTLTIPNEKPPRSFFSRKLEQSF